jgi:hypothetical protein
MGVYLLLHEVAEKTLIECTGLKDFVTVGLQLASKNEPTRVLAHETTFTDKNQQVSLHAA